MENPSYIALAQQRALQRQMDVIANNVANVSTPGFRAERVMFRELISDKATIPGLKGIGARTSFAEEVGTLRDTRTGGFERTGNQLDVAINGNGYFVVETPDGPRYTRFGGFRPDADGKLVSPEGHAVLGEGNQPITLRAGETDIEIDRRGGITGKDGQIGKFRVVRFEDDQRLVKGGDGLYDAAGQDPLPVDERVQVAQGSIEGSNVQGVLEITTMMELLRRYQSAQRLVEQEHDRARRAIDKLSRVS